ncbi:hypothetical protein MOC86_21940, partial [Priestia endophytica]|nr:hypothetical protein [Priestia endophytica]
MVLRLNTFVSLIIVS